MVWSLKRVTYFAYYNDSDMLKKCMFSVFFSLAKIPYMLDFIDYSMIDVIHMP